ncbi:MAG: putative Ig domain-containing protein [Leptospiraceae bacterium]|nr:putative Ig domain-containing protein [Leptospiraceae bacterium]
MNATTCAISGTPTTAQSAITYTITAANAAGSATATINISINLNTIYAATAAGLSISTDGGTSFVNRTTANGLGSNTVNGLYVQ